MFGYGFDSLVLDMSYAVIIVHIDCISIVCDQYVEKKDKTKHAVTL